MCVTYILRTEISKFINQNSPTTSINFYFFQINNKIYTLILSHQIEVSFTHRYFKNEKVRTFFIISIDWLKSFKTFQNVFKKFLKCFQMFQMLSKAFKKFPKCFQKVFKIFSNVFKMFSKVFKIF